MFFLCLCIHVRSSVTLISTNSYYRAVGSHTDFKVKLNEMFDISAFYNLIECHRFTQRFYAGRPVRQLSGRNARVRLLLAHHVFDSELTPWQ